MAKSKGLPSFFDAVLKNYPNMKGDFGDFVGKGERKPWPPDLVSWIEQVGWPKMAEDSLPPLALTAAIDLMLVRSPIEVMLYFALRTEFADEFQHDRCRIAINHTVSRILSTEPFFAVSRAPWDQKVPKKQDVDYEIDIYLEIGPDYIGNNIENYFRYAIECDGHDYHERTKEQARKDKVKDRTLAEAGFSVIHFTGSEIYRNAFECAKQVRGRHKAEYDRLRSLFSQP